MSSLGMLSTDLLGSALEISGSGSSVNIDLDIPEGWGRRHREIDAYLEITVPLHARVSVETVSADIKVSGLNGAADLSSVSGSVRLAGDLERAEVETVSGDIDVEGGKTPVTAESVSGDVTLNGVTGSVEAVSVSGNVEVTADQVDRARFESVSGNIDFRGSLGSSARLTAETHSGNTHLYLPADTSATFEVETFSGSISNDFGAEPKRSGGYTHGKWLKFSTGSGAAHVSVDTFSGNVHLKKL